MAEDGRKVCWSDESNASPDHAIIDFKPSVPIHNHERWVDNGDDDDSVVSFPRASDRVRINVGGQVHETRIGTLRRIPETRLWKLAMDYENDKAYDKETGTFFFNRNPSIFLSVIQYYRTGELHVDHHTCGNAIQCELDFWQIDANDIEPCCWGHYASFISSKEALKQLDDAFAVYEDAYGKPQKGHGWKAFQQRFWRHLEDPSYSIIGKVFSSLSVIFVCLSIAAYILETHSFFIEIPPEEQANNGTTTPIDGSIHHPHVVWWLTLLTYLCFGYFVFEYFIRLIFCPNKKEFCKSILNNIDLLVLVAMFVEIMVTIVSYETIPQTGFLKILIPVRFARIIRILKLMKHYRAFQVLAYTIKVSVKELILMVIFLCLGVVVFACIVYYVEPENFENIPIGMWWALITMTTVISSFTHFLLLFLCFFSFC